MPTQTVSIADLFDEIHVDIEGDKFKLREATRSVEEKYRAKLREIESKEEEVDGLGDDVEAEARVVSETLEMYGDLLDIWLEPLGEKKTHAKTLIKQAYKDDKIGLVHLSELVKRIGEAGQRRPT